MDITVVTRDGARIQSNRSFLKLLWSPFFKDMLPQPVGTPCATVFPIPLHMRDLRLVLDIALCKYGSEEQLETRVTYRWTTARALMDVVSLAYRFHQVPLLRVCLKIMLKMMTRNPQSLLEFIKADICSFDYADFHGLIVYEILGKYTMKCLDTPVCVRNERGHPGFHLCSPSRAGGANVTISVHHLTSQEMHDMLTLLQRRNVHHSITHEYLFLVVFHWLYRKPYHCVRTVGPTGSFSHTEFLITAPRLLQRRTLARSLLKKFNLSQMSLWFIKNIVEPTGIYEAADIATAYIELSLIPVARFLEVYRPLSNINIAQMSSAQLARTVIDVCHGKEERLDEPWMSYEWKCCALVQYDEEVTECSLETTLETFDGQLELFTAGYPTEV